MIGKTDDKSMENRHNKSIPGTIVQLIIIFTVLVIIAFYIGNNIELFLF